MSLFVVLQSGNQLARHIGAELPKLVNETVIEIQADCDELDYISRHFQDIPFAWHAGAKGTDGKQFNRVQRWFGDHAKFIYHNLRC